MQNNLKHYIQFYLGGKIVFENKTYTVEGIYGDIIITNKADASGDGQFPIEDCKLILRRLNSMTETESEFITDASMQGKPTIYVNAEVTKYLLSNHFDLFGLIEAGLAIDKTTLNP